MGRKKAERLVLELHDQFADLSLGSTAPRAPGGDEAVRALLALGYPPAAADDAVRAALAAGAPAEPHNSSGALSSSWPPVEDDDL